MKKIFIILIVLFIAIALFIFYNPFSLSEPSYTFFCGDTINYKGQDYRTVEIMGNCWLQENLNVGEMIKSEKAEDVQTTAQGKIQKYCYDNDIKNCDIYGGLYQWHTAMNLPDDPCLNSAEKCTDQIQENHQGICPEAWRIPTIHDYKNLVADYSDGSRVLGSGYSPGQFVLGGESGFESLITGTRNAIGGSFDQLDDFAMFWTSSIYDQYVNYFMVTPYLAGHSFNIPRMGYSVRCIK